MSDMGYGYKDNPSTKVAFDKWVIVQLVLKFMHLCRFN